MLGGFILLSFVPLHTRTIILVGSVANIVTLCDKED